MTVCPLAGCSLAGILAVMHSALDMKATLAGNHPHLFYLLASALRPRMLMTLDAEGKLLPVPVRVGQAVDTVAQVAFLPACRRQQCVLMGKILGSW